MNAYTLGLRFSQQDSDLRSHSYRLDKDGYARRTVNRKPLAPITVKAHMEVMERKLGRKLAAGELIDHKNRNRLDCRRRNLRLADKSLNGTNRGPQKNNSLGHKNVILLSRGRKRFRWSFMLRGVLYYGHCETLKEALRDLKIKKREVGYVEMGEI